MPHPAAATGFARSADAYDRGRPNYSRPALDWLTERLDLHPGRTVVDLAAGTGKLTRPLAATGADLIAVEPVPEMRAAIGPPARVLEGTAESIPLPPASADAVTVGQAFHWFDPDPALAEIHRILRLAGALALIWNTRLRDDPLHHAIDELLEPHRHGVPRHRDGNWRTAIERSPLFGPIEERSYPNVQELDADGLADRVGSISFVASLADDLRKPLLDRIRALAGGGVVSLPYRTEIQVCTRVEA
jgi:SAM-dependent methyltransferase